MISKLSALQMASIGRTNTVTLTTRMKAPKMFVNTTGARYIYLPRCVDDWEIRYYYCYSDMDYGDHSRHNHLKYAGVVNLNEYFGEYIKRGLFFRTYHEPLIQCQVLLDSSPVYFFHEEG